MCPLDVEYPKPSALIVQLEWPPPLRQSTLADNHAGLIFGFVSASTTLISSGTLGFTVICSTTSLGRNGSPIGIGVSVPQVGRIQRRTTTSFGRSKDSV